MRNPRNEPLADHDIAEATDPSNGPERRCILSGRIASRDELLRLAISPDGDVLPDALAKAPGRGAWVGVTQAELTEALANGKLKGALARAFKNGKIAISETLPVLAEQALTRAFLDRLGLEMRSGRLILGSERIASEARMGRVAALYHAADASDDGSRKLDQAWRVGSEAEGSGLSGLRLPLDRAALSVALGRDNVVHLALADAASAGRVAIPLQRLVIFLGAPAASLDEDACRAGDDAASASMATNEF
ncbi:DUF448 domain-containing protein [Altererythrobacter sp. Root672]|uniref:DUF448 domain-containing protein n=1 Tax=Altererythrobacter sp. Root672 TaxID=1736584 RepID=UPI0006F4D27D|nr:DUF448 domain-containing protein [Altererythrobacter sp. Root672]KRA84132.1 hypothetical protein ASD76_09090 [Altererythrobacter sp. Root672]